VLRTGEWATQRFSADSGGLAPGSPCSPDRVHGPDAGGSVRARRSQAERGDPSRGAGGRQRSASGARSCPAPT